jgi:predicted acyltransferase
MTFSLQQPQSDSTRLVSLDALRGFDMFLIAGAENMTRRAAEYTDWELLKRIESEFHHPEWNGFTFFDLIFPLFMFLSGVSFTFSLNKRINRGEDLRTLYLHVFLRGCTLILLGAVCNGLLSLDLDNIIYASVLGRIGLGYIGGAILAISVRHWRGRLSCCAAILLGYWAVMALLPVPGFGAGDLRPGHTLASYIDRMLIPGRLYATDRDPNGLFATIPSIVNVLAGIMTGELIRRTDKSGYAKVAIMFFMGIGCWLIGQLWNSHFPINKNLWSSSFVMVTIGWSLLFLALFYLLIDVWKLRAWAFVFVVIGMNPLLIYIAQQFIAFRDIAHLILHDEQSKLHPLFIEIFMFLMKWSVLYYLYRRRIFWRV